MKKIKNVYLLLILVFCISILSGCKSGEVLTNEKYSGAKLGLAIKIDSSIEANNKKVTSLNREEVNYLNKVIKNYIDKKGDITVINVEETNLKSKETQKKLKEKYNLDYLLTINLSDIRFKYGLSKAHAREYNLTIVLPEKLDYSCYNKSNYALYDLSTFELIVSGNKNGSFSEVIDNPFYKKGDSFDAIRKRIEFDKLYSRKKAIEKTIVDSIKMSAREHVELIGGLTMNTFNLDMSLNGEEFFDGSNAKSELKSGKGLYFGGRIWLTQKSGIEFGFDGAMAYDEINEYIGGNYINILGLYGGYLYKLNDDLNLKLGSAKYSYEFSPRSGLDQKGEGLGFFIDGELHKRIGFIALKGNLGYRLANISITQIEDENNYGEYINLTDDYKINMGGLRLGGGLSIVF